MSAGVDPAVIEELREAFEGGDLVLFVGSGVAAAAGLPTWRQLVEAVTEWVRERGHDQMVVDELAEFARSQRTIEALAAAEHALGLEELAAFIERQLDDTGIETPPLARALAALRDKVRAVVTTNMNHLIERAFGWDTLARVTDEVATRRRFVLKLHGTLDDRTSWVFTRTRFHASLSEPGVRAAFASLLSTCPVLFVGFGRADENFDQMLRDVRALSGDNPPPRFALVPKGSLMPYRRRTLEDVGFKLLPYDNLDGQHANALQILEQLRGATRSQVRTAPRSILPPAFDMGRDSASAGPSIPDLEVPPSSSAPFALFRDFGFDDLVPSSGATSAPAVSGQRLGSPRPGPSDPPANPIEIFFSYAQKDRELRDKLETHLAILKRKGVIRGWHEGEISAGEEFDRAIREHLEAAKLILLLVSADFLASDFCYEEQMRRAIRRHKHGDARVIPVILDACDWEGAPFRDLAPLPTSGKPVTSWANQSEAFTDIAKGIRKQVDQLTQNPS